MQPRRWKSPSTADKSGGSTDRGFISYADGEKLVVADHFGPGMIFWIYWTHDSLFIKPHVCVEPPHVQAYAARNHILCTGTYTNASTLSKSMVRWLFNSLPPISVASRAKACCTPSCRPSTSLPATRITGMRMGACSIL